MIEGIRADIKSDELALKLNARADHHTKRAAEQKAKAETLKSGDDVHAAANLRMKAKGHERKAERMKFIASHLVAGEMYRLEPNDIEQLELTVVNEVPGQINA